MNDTEPDYKFVDGNTIYPDDIGFEFMFDFPLYDIRSIIENIYRLKAYIHDDVTLQIHNEFLLSLEQTGWTRDAMRNHETFGKHTFYDGMASHIFKTLVDRTIGFEDRVPLLSFDYDGDDEQYINVRMKISEMKKWLKTKGVSY